jgi:hypothetical protein
MTQVYEKQTWSDGPVGATPPTAERLSHIESGIFAAATRYGLNRQEDTYTATSDDVGRIIEINSPSTVSVVVPHNLTDPVPVGSFIEVVQIGTGQVNIVGETVAVLIRSASALNTGSQYGRGLLYKRGLNDWVWSRLGGAGIVLITDHGMLTGLGDDDHPQYQLRSEEGVAGGYASLDGSALLPLSQLPAHPHGTSDITGLAEFIRDTIGTALVAGANITVTVNDPGDTITIAVSGLTAADISDFSEAVDDRVAALLVAGAGITLTYNDPANTLTIESSGSLVRNIVSVSATYAALTSDSVIIADATGGAFTVTLPSAASTTGQVYDIKRINSGGNKVTVAASGGAMIDGAASVQLTIQYENISMISDGTDWHIL